jgi:hypothetical protein
MSSQNSVGNLKITDLETVTKFSAWLKQNLGIYNPDDEVPMEHVKIFVKYISDCVRDNPKIDSRFWLKVLNDLEKHIVVEEKHDV